MRVRLAESAGYCYGVKRAVELALEAAQADAAHTWTLGALIHNRRATERLHALGLREAKQVEEIPPGASVIIRSHGVGAAVYRELEARGCRVLDATCPNVARIHRLVQDISARGRIPIVIGSREHPEVVGICGHCTSPLVYKNAKEMEERIFLDIPERDTPVSLVQQTTETRENAKKCAALLKKVYTNTEFFDTICGATSRRQEEAERLSKACGAMVVVGDRESANSLRLAEICERNCQRVVFAECTGEVELSSLEGAAVVGLTAGASTPDWIIKEVYDKMTEENKELETTGQGSTAVEDGMSFDEMLEKNFKTLNTGEKVVGIVQSISPTEVTVDLGTKHSGYIPVGELSDDAELKPEDIVQVGGEVEAYVVRVNDVEGTVMLSKKRLDVVKNWETIEAAVEDKTVFEGNVVETNKGGLVMMVKGIRVFVPASQSGLPRGADLDALVKTRQQVRITEVNPGRRRVIGSIRAVQQEARRAAAEKVWEEIEVGKTYTGVVKTLTSYGAFVDIGGVDGMVHVTELSWRRVRNPAEIVSVGDEITVHVLSFDKEKRKISLSCKTEETNPWNQFTATYSVGSVAEVKIVKLMPFGAFAEVVPGVDGLIHISQISAERRINKAEEVLTVGQTVRVKITAIDMDRQKISLSIRALSEEPAAPVEEAEEEPAVEDDEPVVVYDTEHAEQYADAVPEEEPAE